MWDFLYSKKIHRTGGLSGGTRSILTAGCLKITESSRREGQRTIYNPESLKTGLNFIYQTATCHSDTNQNFTCFNQPLISLWSISCATNLSHSERQELLGYTLTAVELYSKLILVFRRKLFLFLALWVTPESYIHSVWDLMRIPRLPQVEMSWAFSMVLCSED